MQKIAMSVHLCNTDFVQGEPFKKVLKKYFQEKLDKTQDLFETLAQVEVDAVKTVLVVSWRSQKHIHHAFINSMPCAKQS
jgi:hypothetical protein